MIYSPPIDHCPCLTYRPSQFQINLNKVLWIWNPPNTHNTIVWILRWGSAWWKKCFLKALSCKINTHSFIHTFYEMTHFREAHPFILWLTNVRNKRFINYIKMFFLLFERLVSSPWFLNKKSSSLSLWCGVSYCHQLSKISLVSLPIWSR